MKRIDTHQHLWDLKRFPYSWCAGIPALNRTFDLNDYLAAARDTGVEKTVFVEGDVDEPHGLAEAEHIQSLGENHPLIGGIVASARPERTDFPRQLDALLGLTKLRGLRRVLHVVPDGVSQSELFVVNVRRLAEHKLTFDLCVLARQLPLAIKLARQCPEVQFILDHGGVPDVNAKAFEPWRSNIKELARLSNVAGKISGLPAYAGGSWQVDDLRPWVEHLLACFGWERVLWGGDWPVCTLTTTLRHWVAATDELLAGATGAEREKLFYANAEKFYRV
jgi:predicted TIM-barrel fold metal-dependent hydrolase